MSPACISYVAAVRSRRHAPRIGSNDLITVIRSAHWRWKQAADQADRWKRVRDRAVRDLDAAQRARPGQPD